MPGLVSGLLCAIAWAIGSVSMRKLSDKLDPLTLNAPRSLIAGVFVLLYTLVSGRGTGFVDVSWSKAALLIGSVWIGGGLGDSAYISSMSRIGVSRAFAISNTYPVLTLLFALAFLSERATWGVAAGLALVLGGVALLSRAERAERVSTHLADKQGVLLAVLAAVCWAVANVVMAPGVKGLDPIMISSIRVPAFSLLAWGAVATRKTWPQLARLSRAEWLTITVGGLIGWGLGSILFVHTVATIGATRSAILTSTAPLFALPMSAVLLSERLTRRTLMGSVLAVCGVALVSI